MAKQSLTQRQSGKQTQKQTQTQTRRIGQQQIASLDMLQAEYHRVLCMVNCEMENNPLLEAANPALLVSGGNPTEEYDRPPAPERSDPHHCIRDDNNSDKDFRRDSGAGEGRENDSRDPAYSAGGVGAGRQDNFDPFWNIQDSSGLPTLVEVMDRQLVELEARLGGTAIMRCCTEIVEILSERGFLRASPKTIAGKCKCDVETARAAMREVRNLWPPGVAASSLRQCLMLQLERKGRRNSLAWRLLRRHADLLEEYLYPGRDQLSHLAWALRLSKYEVEAAVAELRSLVPFPSCYYPSVRSPQIIMPDVTFELDEDRRPLITYRNETTPRLRIANRYVRLLESKDVDDETKSFISEKKSRAEEIAQMLRERKKTIVNVADCIVSIQSEFFVKGNTEILAPLTKRQLAGMLNLDESTVVRAVKDKYMMTPYGLFSFEHFFSAGAIESKDGAVSARTVEQAIREIIAEEDRRKPLSDRRINDELAARGYKMVERTVTKYRRQLKIGSSRERKNSP